jgi:esterase/lipase superfamily enzyme
MDYRQNELSKKMPRIIKRLWQNTGKKVMIVAHSFGNLQTANVLWNMSQSDKDTMVARYIGLAPPYIGAPQAIKPAIGFDKDMAFNIFGK